MSTRDSDPRAPWRTMLTPEERERMAEIDDRIAKLLVRTRELRAIRRATMQAAVQRMIRRGR